MKLRVTLLFTLVFSALFSTMAQTPQAPLGPEFLQRDRLRLEGDTLRFCVVNDNVVADYHRDLAQELAATQLLQAEIYEVTPPRPSEPLDYRLTLTEAQIYYLLANDCEVFMGFALTSALSRWEWLLVSQPYHVSRTVFISPDDSLDRWTDLDHDEAIATRIQTSGDIQLAMYLNSLAESVRWKRIPYYNNQVALEQMLAGQAAIAYLWEPAVTHFEAANPGIDSFTRLPNAPLDTSLLTLGLGFRTQDAFIQTTLDQAIVELETLGILQELANRHNLPALTMDRRE